MNKKIINSIGAVIGSIGNTLKNIKISISHCIVFLVLAFIYIPMISMMVYSFNVSRLVTVWGGFSFKWYLELLTNEQILSAAWLSIKVAFISATVATILGTMAAFALVRFGNFRGRILLLSSITSPLVMPEIITGLSLLLLFIGIESLLGWPQRGSLTVIIAHITFCIAYVAVVVQARLQQFDHSIEEAAWDLGAKHREVFLYITLPIISPSLITGWLLAFVLSWDDLIISSFVIGPGSNTLPIVVFSKVRLGISPEINALATIVIVIVAICVTMTMLYLQRKQNIENKNFLTNINKQKSLDT